MRILIVCLIASLAGACSEGSKPPKAKPHHNLRPSVPSVRIGVGQPTPAKATLTVLGLEVNADPEGDTVSYKIAWTRNGVPAEHSAAATQVTTELSPPAGIVYAEIVTKEAWRATITPFDSYGAGETAAVEAEISLRIACDPSPADPTVDFVDCKREFVYPVTYSGSIPTNEEDARIFFTEVIRDGFLPPVTNAVHEKTENFFNLVVFRMFAKTADAVFDFDPETFAYRPVTSPIGPYSGPSRVTGLGGYDPFPIDDRECIDVPLVGTACLNTFIWDVDNDPHQRVFSFEPNEVSTMTLTETGGAWQFSATVTGHIDILIEPPNDPDLYDIPNNTASNTYDPRNDLSTYLKAYSRIKVSFTASFIVDTGTPGTLKLRLTQVDTDQFQVLLNRGPYCNNNLGTQRDRTVTFSSTLSADPIYVPAPFVNGNASYPGLVSDTDGATLITSYYARLSEPYPHIASSPTGGSGAGRDAIGVNSFAYEYHDGMGRHSDNPNNCRRPADACTVSLAQAGGDPNSMQDGGSEWQGISGSCEYPNISDDGDDSTFKISEQITSIVPYIKNSFSEFLGGGIHPL